MSLIDAVGWEQLCPEQAEQHERLNAEPATCTKKNSRDSFQVKCSCGLQMTVEISLWRDFKLCPKCGTQCKGRWSNGSKQRK